MKKFILVLVVFSFVAISSRAQTLDTILKKHFEATGSAKLAKINSMKIVTLTTAQTMEINQEMYIKRPNKIRTDVNMMGQEIVMLFDGENAYMKNPMMGEGFNPIYGAQAENLVKRADLDGALYNYKQKGNEVEYIGKETIEGVEYFKLKVVMPDISDTESFWYIDSNTYLLGRQEGLAKFQGQQVNLVSVFSEYRNEDGIAIFGRMTSSVDGVEQISMEILDVEYNIEIEDSMFEAK